MEMEFDNNLGEEDILLRAENIKMIVMDVDGTLTDGKIFVGNEGELMKAFDVKDGQGIVLWHKSGKQSAIITSERRRLVYSMSIRGAPISGPHTKTLRKRPAWTTMTSAISATTCRISLLCLE